MRYADSNCTYIENFNPSHVYIFTGKCIVTGKMHSVTVPGNELQEYRKGIKLIQDAMPSLSAEDREFLISGTSPEGWKELFKDET